MPPSGNHLQQLPRSVALVSGKGSFLRKLPIEFALGPERLPFWQRTPKPANVARPGHWHRFNSVPLKVTYSGCPGLLLLAGRAVSCGNSPSSLPWGPERLPFWRSTPKPANVARLDHYRSSSLLVRITCSGYPSPSLSAGRIRWWGSRCCGTARRGCRWRPRTPSLGCRNRRRGSASAHCGQSAR